MLKVSPWKGVARFGNRGKLNPRYVGPFEILARVGPVAYKLKLPQELSNVHDTFHVSNLKKCLSDETLIIPPDEIHIDDKLHFIEEPMEVTDWKVQRTRRSRVKLVKSFSHLPISLKFRGKTIPLQSKPHLHFQSFSFFLRQFHNSLSNRSPVLKRKSPQFGVIRRISIVLEESLAKDSRLLLCFSLKIAILGLRYRNYSFDTCFTQKSSDQGKVIKFKVKISDQVKVIRFKRKSTDQEIERGHQSNTSFINSITFYSQETVQIISQASNLHSRSNCYQLIKELDPPIISKVSEGLEQPESQQKPPEANLTVAGTPFYRSL
ncbi:hypothetical protein L1987_48504 [Smallanthus sonchifolius]|uniref:Uncharacterized protein n=1 Tax=Smallanthus sonchifolius TaxID=185202 RepID=A0ACB9FRI0_9ASTR|nr:hypothetical protein L1987_48504 [Smallanthus sonchifolius]